MRVILDVGEEKLTLIRNDRATFGWVFWRFLTSRRQCWIDQLHHDYGMKVVEIDGVETDGEVSSLDKEAP